MRRFGDLSIRYKLTLMLLGVAGIVMSAVSVANVVIQVRATRASILMKYSTLAKIVAAQSSAALSIADIDPSGAQQIASELTVAPLIRRAAFFNTEGRVVARYPDHVRDNLPTPREAGAAFTESGFLDVFEEVKLADGTVVGWVYLSAKTDELHAQVRRAIVIAVVVSVVALIAAFVLSSALQRLISAPILQLADLARRVSTEHNYALRAETGRNDELGTLCRGFNTMLGEIQRREEELASHRTHLEELVQQRTQVLKARTEELIRSNEELTRSREALEAANKELEAFSYSVSHDLRAPLRHIQGFVALLMGEKANELTEKSRHYLETVSGCACEMGQLIDDLLAFSRMSRAELSAVRVPLDQLVRDVIGELRIDETERNIEWEIGPLPEVVGDVAMLKLLWTNLLSNALKYTRPRDPAVIEVGCLPGDDDMATLFVRDNGVGFDMQYYNKLFGVFQRLHGTEEFEGTGIGLANVRRIVARHGGRVWADGVPDAGATFYFTLKRWMSDDFQRKEGHTHANTAAHIAG